MSENATQWFEPDESNADQPASESADRSLAEIEARLDELDDEEEQADELTELFTDAIDALGAIAAHPLVGNETETKISMLRTMTRQTRQHDVRVHRAIHHERDALRRQAWELKREEKNSEARDEQDDTEDGESQ